MLYSSECYNDDVPYWVDLPSEAELPVEQREGMLLVPYNYDCDDGKFHMAPGFMSSAGQGYYEYLVSTFHCLYREGGKVRSQIFAFAYCCIGCVGTWALSVVC